MVKTLGHMAAGVAVLSRYGHMTSIVIELKKSYQT